MSAIRDWATPENLQPEPITVEIWRELSEEFCRQVEVVNGQAVRCEAPRRAHQAAARRLATVLDSAAADYVALHPGTKEPVGPDDLAPLFPMALIEQEMTGAPTIDIPGPVLDILRLWRPTPLVRAVRLEKALGTPARIYYKDESVSPAGSHKPNTAVAQAYYNKESGTPRLATETGAGQWGSALAFACSQFDLECKVYMVRASYEQKPYRRVLMETWGASVVPSPVDDQTHPGSLGAAISDAVRDAGPRADTHYSLGSVLNHVLLHQTVIGIEAKEQLALAGETRPDVVIGSYPFMDEKIGGNTHVVVRSRDPEKLAAAKAAVESMLVRVKAALAADQGAFRRRS